MTTKEALLERAGESDSSIRLPTTSGEHPLMLSASIVAVPAGVRVLVADDDPRIVRAIASTLTRIGFDVRVANDGAPAMVMAEQSPPDLAIIDLGMPTGGNEVVRRLKELFGTAIHVQILSGTDEEEARLAAFDAGADGFLTKPISMKELQRRLVAAARSQRAYIEARQAREQADRLLAWGTEAAALLAHDLNNGLAVALSNMSYLSQVLTVTDDQGQALASTLRALKRMSGLVANFVDVSRFEDEALKPRPGVVRVRELMLEVMAVHAPSIGRDVRHAVTCDPELLGHFDEALVARVLHNLVGNAARYCHAGGMIRLTATGRPTIADEPPTLDITVENTGPHIAPHLADKLFGKYALGKGGQRGLGLYFCRLACEAHGGTIRYVATPDGPSFVLTLPRSPRPAGMTAGG
ncbi:MAG TPA: response regulator [Kofleriaceae bacterium]|nr:response regulator [Kofleriaceae bacterium]